MAPTAWVTLLAWACAGGPESQGPVGSTDSAFALSGAGVSQSVTGAAWASRCVFTFTESDRGDSKESAEEMALERARTRLTEYLREKRPALCWEPSDQFLRLNRMIHTLTVSDYSSERLGHMYNVEVRGGITREQLHEMLELDYKERVRQRHFLTGKLFAALLVFALLFAGYVRLEEVCRGFFSGLLKVGLVAGVTLVGAGLWWVL